MEKHVPYYMAYPMPLQFDDERTEKRDLEYLKSMYPSTAKIILPYVEEECEKMEYKGSMIYDEYPDRLQIRLLCGKIYDKVKDLPVVRDKMTEETEGMAQAFRERKKRDGHLWDLVEVLVFQELFRKRCAKRKCRRRYF